MSTALTKLAGGCTLEVSNDRLDLPPVASGNEVDVIGHDAARVEYVSALLHSPREPLSHREGLMTVEGYRWTLQCRFRCLSRRPVVPPRRN